MKELFEGVKKFSKDKFEKNKQLYQNLSKKQNPHTLFIACSDSRVVPNLITTSLPGELFVIRILRKNIKIKSLKIYGWYYDIEKGIVYNYNRSNREFERIEY